MTPILMLLEQGTTLIEAAPWSASEHIARGIGVILLLAVAAFWYVRRHSKTDRESRSPWLMKWALTLLLVYVAIMAVPWFSVYGLFVIVACAVVFSLLWAPSIGGWAASPLTSMYDGGSIPMESKPLLGPVEAKRKRGQNAEAVAELRGLMEKFPGEFETQLLFAAIHAENLGDLDRARTAIHRLVNQTEHPRNLRAFALTQLADWELSLSRDGEAARQCFERIQQLFPDTEYAINAAQRIAHLPAFAAGTPADSPAAIPLPSTASPELRAEELTRHLGHHPYDAEARENLATLFAEELGQLEMAVQQLETMIAQPNQPPRKLARWLNRIADIHIHQGDDEAAARATLNRIAELFPGTQFAELAVLRREKIAFELRGKQTSRAVKLGSYEDDLGLKRGLTSS